MAITNFSELKSAIADTLNRSDLTSVIPHFITLAEANFNRNLRTRQMIARSDASIDSQYTALPSDFEEMRSFYLKTNPVTELKFLPIEDMQRMKSDYLESVTGKPKYFSIIGDTVEMLPSPDGAYTAELIYHAKIPVLSDSNTTNWLLTSYPDAYLYGSLIHSAPYLKDDARISLWDQLLTNVVLSINLANERAEFSGGVLRARVNRSY